MIISRTPFRISFFGGGTDYPIWFRENKGAVLSVTINKYCYISCRKLPPFFDHKHRIIYSKFEHINDINSIQHPAVRAVFKYFNIKNGLEVHHDADLPARSGLGSSSSFTVGLLNALYALEGQMVSKMRLAKEAIDIEQNIIKEHVGSQDQCAAAFGGFNRFDFFPDNSIGVAPIIISSDKLKYFQNHFLFFFTRTNRYASDIAKVQIDNTKNKKQELLTMYQMVDEAISIIQNSNSSFDEFGSLMHDAWLIKRELSDKITNPLIDQIYETGRNAGAIGGKLIGAGGGGFILFFVRPTKHKRVKEALKDLLHVPFSFDRTGSQIIFYNFYS